MITFDIQHHRDGSAVSIEGILDDTSLDTFNDWLGTLLTRSGRLLLDVSSLEIEESYNGYFDELVERFSIELIGPRRPVAV